MMSTLEVIIAIGTIIGMLIGAIAYIYRTLLKPIYKFIKDTSDRNDKIDTIYYEVQPNSGGSLKDKVNSIVEKIQILEDKQDALFRIMPFATFETDGEGSCIYVNKIWCEWTGMNETDAHGFGWLNSISHDDKERVLNEWSIAIRSNSSIRTQYTLKNVQTGNEKEVLLNSMIVRTPSGKVNSVIGVMTDHNKLESGAKTS